jgi:hypothetical protein
VTKYQYDERIQNEIKRCLRGLFDPGIQLRPATKQQDFGGVDVRWIVDRDVELQLRVRFNRPAYASDSDITFRTTEPAMIAAHTYAKLAVFMWVRDDQVKAAKLVDIYRMAERLQPTLKERLEYAEENDDGTAFIAVEISELHHVGALLRIYDGNVWATSVLGGELRLNRILNEHRHKASQLV